MICRTAVGLLAVTITMQAADYVAVSDIVRADPSRAVTIC
jgi:hypothetical protein